MKTLITLAYIFAATVTLLLSTNALALMKSNYNFHGDPEGKVGALPPGICPEGAARFYAAQLAAANAKAANASEEVVAGTVTGSIETAPGEGTK
ncbi:MAG: hypothetical protein ABL958_09900 [Bdellovibrionia bacterium]